MIKFLYGVRVLNRPDDPKFRQALLEAISSAATKVINQQFGSDVLGISETPEEDRQHFTSTATIRRRRRQ